MSWAVDYHSPRTAALGGSGRAGPLLNDAIMLNPSFGSFLPVYSISANYSLFNGPSFGTASGPAVNSGRVYNASIQDGRTEFLQAGASFTQREDAAFVHVGLSKAFLKRYSGGLTSKIMRNNQTGAVDVDLVFSATGVFADWLQVALVADNLIQQPATQNYGLYREFTLGTKFNAMGIVLAYFDPFAAPSLPINAGGLGYAAGLEFVFFKDFFLRVGNFYNAQVPFQGIRGSGAGLGLGWVAPRISLDYGFQRVFGPRQAFAHTFGTTVYF